MLYIGIWPHPVPFDGLNEKRIMKIAGDHWIHLISFTLLAVLLPYATLPRLPFKLTVVICVIGAFASEGLQGLCPWKRFDWFDVLANLLGISFGSITVIATERVSLSMRQNTNTFELIDTV
jgi:glycopeptide antibiotics resistance protein